jgi:hypothetical protein
LRRCDNAEPFTPIIAEEGDLLLLDLRNELEMKELVDAVGIELVVAIDNNLLILKPHQ